MSAITAFLPAQLLHIAAQFASTDFTDSTKKVLTGIYVRPAEGGGIIIDSTDGHRAFHAEALCSPWECSESLLIDAKPLRKRIGYARFAVIDTEVGNDIRVSGGKTTVAEFIQSVPLHLISEQYPNIDQCWPESFTNAPGELVSFNAAYLADFLAEVKRYSGNGTATMEINSPTSPLKFTAKMAGDSLSDVTLSYLLMPVQIRG